jgi:uncharacterized membrane protein
LIAGSQVILRRGWTYFSEGITALGAGVLYLSLYAAWNYYALVPTEVAFVGMAVVTASLIILALTRNTQRLAMLAMLGGYVTPLLVSTGHDAQIPLFSYLALLNAGLLWMALARDWRSLPLSFLFTLVYGLTWYTHFYDPAKLIPSLTFASVFFVEFALLPAIQARRNGALRADAVALTLLNAGWYLAALDVMLYSSHRWGLTAGVLAVAAFYLILANFTARQSDRTQPAARPIFGSVALTCATVSIPIRLEGQWIVMAWAFESLILVWNGIQSGTAWLRGAGLIVLFAVTLYLLEIAIPSPQPFLNGRFATYVIVAAALGIAGWLARRNDRMLGEGERLAFKCAEVVSNLIALIGLSAETIQLLGPVSPIAVDTSEAEQLLGLSLVWALYACALAAIGLIGDLARVRYQAYALFTVVLVKAMFLDSQYTIAESAHPFVNLRFLTSAVIFAALAFSLVLSQRRVSSLPPGELSVHRAFQVALNVFAVWALTIELWHAFPVNAQEFAVSLVWTAYAGILIVIGIRRESALVRWQALVLFGCVILKAVFVDLAMLALGYRVASFFALGVILVGASFLYQRRLFGQGTTKP